MTRVGALLIAALWPCLLVAADDAAKRELYLGADLSYVNEMEDCGGVVREGGKPRDAFQLLRERGGNLVRVRLFNNATWTKYSNLDDVRKTLRRARAAGMPSFII